MSVPTISYAARSLRLRLPRVVVSIADSDPTDLELKAEQALRENSFLEFRLDYQKNPLLAIQKIKRLMDYRPDMISIATCRRKQAGGNFSGSVASQLEILTKASAAGCQIADLELESAEALKPAELERFRSTVNTLLLSYHDYKTTKNLDETLARMLRFNADFYKVISTATCLHDNVVMMKFLQKNADHHFMIGHCMGEQGIISRVLSVRAGSVFTFGSAGQGEETAPGQVTMRELRDLYRIEHVDAVTKVYGVVGDPVSHSLSPYIMNAAFRRENVKSVYLRLHAKKFDDLMACVNEIPIHGLSVTIPYKQETVKHLDNSDMWTKRTGASNTVVRGQDGRLFGFNTDVAGIIVPLEEHVTLQGAKVLVLGAGGVARAAVFGLQQRGADVSILNRTPQRAVALAKESGTKTIKRSDLPKLDFDVIINATSVGMGNPKQSPLEEKELRAKIIFDLVYNPYETKLLKMAREQQLIAISGVEMFVQQGARQFEIWTGFPAPLEEMRQVVFRQLGEKPIPATPAGQRAAAAALAKAQEQEAAKYQTEPTPPAPAPAKKATKVEAKATAVKTAPAKPAPAAKPAPTKPVATAKNNGKPPAKAPAKPPAKAVAVKAKAPAPKPSATAKKSAPKKPTKPLPKAKKR
jgi:3-dehydroquinate dehydratase/shikimate dehydrogenase